MVHFYLRFPIFFDENSRSHHGAFSVDVQCLFDVIRNRDSGIVDQDINLGFEVGFAVIKCLVPITLISDIQPMVVLKITIKRNFIGSILTKQR